MPPRVGDVAFHAHVQRLQPQRERKALKGLSAAAKIAQRLGARFIR